MNARHMLREALKDFVFSLSQGAQAAAKTPGIRGRQASLAASLGAPALRQDMIRQRSQEDEDRALKVSQIQDAIKRGEFNDSVQRYKILENTLAPQKTIPAVTSALGIQIAPEQIDVAPHPPVNIPGIGMMSPPSAQSMGQQALAQATAMEKMRTDQNIRQANETATPKVDTNVGNVQEINGRKMMWDPSKQSYGIDLGPVTPKSEPASENDFYPVDDRTVDGKQVPLKRDKKGDYYTLDGQKVAPNRLGVYAKPVNDKSDDPLTTSQRNQTFVNISNKYQADAIVNQSIKGQTAKVIADQIIKDPGKATNQLAALYLYVKNLDADSAVREGEIGLARQTQSYFQTWGTSLARINAGQVISPAAAKELAKATKDLVTAWESTAKTRTQQYKSQAATAGVGPQFDQYLAGFAPVKGGGSTGGSENRTRIKF